MRAATGRVTGGILSLRSLACLGAVAVVLTTAASASGFASSQVMTTRQLGTSAAAVTSCDTDGVKVVPDANITGTAVASVTVSAIAAACGAATLSVHLTSGTGSANGSATVPAGGGSVTVAMSPAIAPSDSMQSDLTLAGP
jgi:hypothetical protein